MRAAISFHNFPDGSRNAAYTLPSRAPGACLNATPQARIG
jgi:hypothetical protein